MVERIRLKKSPNEVPASPSWLKYRSAASDENVQQYRDMRAAFIREVDPQDSIEWVLLEDYLHLQWEVMRLRRWERELVEAATFSGVKRAFDARSRDRLTGKTEAEKSVTASQLAHFFEDNPKTQNPFNPDLIEAEAYLSRRDDLAGIHKKVVSAERRRNAALRIIESRRERMAKRLADISRSFIAAHDRVAAVAENHNGARVSCAQVPPHRNGKLNGARADRTLNGN